MLGEWQIKIYKNNRFLRKILKKKCPEIRQVKKYFKIFLNRNLNIFCLVYLLIFSLVLVLSSICYCSKIIFFSEYFQISESDFVHFRSLFLQVQSRNIDIFLVFHTGIQFQPVKGHLRSFLTMKKCEKYVNCWFDRQ